MEDIESQGADLVNRLMTMHEKFIKKNIVGKKYNNSDYLNDILSPAIIFVAHMICRINAAYCISFPEDKSMNVEMLRDMVLKNVTSVVSTLNKTLYTDLEKFPHLH